MTPARRSRMRKSYGCTSEVCLLVTFNDGFSHSVDCLLMRRLYFACNTSDIALQTLSK